MGKIEIKYKGDMLFETTIGNHSLEIDVPDSMGGKDRGMTPPQLMVAAIASCTAAFAAKYCNNAGINCQDMTVSLEFDKVQDPLRLTNFKMNIKLPNCNDEKRKLAIEKAAGHCPVHESMKHFEGIDFEVGLGN
ncbi:OsmC family protein [Candidatus Woesearchaeota archaeon]|nr:OsmC family protein [Candidatus Woesearchaeota archaeon]